MGTITLADVVLTIGNKSYPVSGFAPGLVMTVKKARQPRVSVQVKFFMNSWRIKVKAKHVTQTKILCTKPTKRQVRKFVKQTRMFDNTLSKYGPAYGARMNFMMADKFHGI